MLKKVIDRLIIKSFGYGFIAGQITTFVIIANAEKNIIKKK